MTTSLTSGGGRIWPATAITKMSGLLWWSASELTTAGGLFVAVWPVKGNGTRVTSPNSEPIAAGIVGLVPALAAGVLGELRHDAGQPAVLIPMLEQADDVLDFGRLVREQASDHFEKVLYSLVPIDHNSPSAAGMSY
jgi:hypothetical protein